MSATQKPAMYRLTDVDFLRTFRRDDIAAAAGCSVGLISQLRTGLRTDVQESIARGIAKACGVDFDKMFADTGRRSFDRN